MCLFCFCFVLFFRFTSALVTLSCQERCVLCLLLFSFTRKFIAESTYTERERKGEEEKERDREKGRQGQEETGRRRET